MAAPRCGAAVVSRLLPGLCSSLRCAAGRSLLHRASVTLPLSRAFASTPISSNPSPSTSPTPLTPLSFLSSPTPSTHDRWTDVLDPSNPPRLTLQHYSLLTKLTQRPSKPSSSSPPTSLHPLLDSAIDHLQSLLTTVGQSDPTVHRELSSLQSQYIQRRDPFSRTLPNPTSLSPSSIVTASSSLPLSPPRSSRLKCRFCRIKRVVQRYPQYSLAYTNLQLLHQFINLRGMIYPRKLTGNCARHQRKLAGAVKRARVMGLLSFTSNWRVPEGWEEQDGPGVGVVGVGGGGGSGSAIGGVWEEMGGVGEDVGVMGVEGTEPTELSALDDLRIDTENIDSTQPGGQRRG